MHEAVFQACFQHTRDAARKIILRRLSHRPPKNRGVDSTGNRRAVGWSETSEATTSRKIFLPPSFFWKLRQVKNEDIERIFAKIAPAETPFPGHGKKLFSETCRLEAAKKAFNR